MHSIACNWAQAEGNSMHSHVLAIVETTCLMDRMP